MYITRGGGRGGGGGGGFVTPIPVTVASIHKSIKVLAKKPAILKLVSYLEIMMKYREMKSVAYLIFQCTR